MYKEGVFPGLEMDMYEIWSFLSIILFLTKISQNEYSGYSTG